MMDGGSGELDLGSDHNLIRCKVRTGRVEKGISVFHI